MLGILPFVFEVSTVLFFPFLAVRMFLNWYYRPTNLYAITRLLGSIVMASAAIFYLFAIFTPQLSSFLTLRELNPANITSIKIGERTWVDQEDIHRIVKTLNQAVWHIPNHDLGGPFVEMIISLRSGSNFVFSVGRYNDKDAVLVSQVSERNNQFYASQYSYVVGLPTTLESLAFSLPPPELGYSTEPKDYLFLWLFLAVYAFSLWPSTVRKKSHKSGPTTAPADGATGRPK